MHQLRNAGCARIAGVRIGVRIWMLRNNDRNGDHNGDRNGDHNGDGQSENVLGAGRSSKVASSALCKPGALGCSIPVLGKLVHL